jgi:cytochrome d ubiquinol oxidase subunit II
MRGFGIVDDAGTIAIVSFKYLRNLLANPWLIALLVVGLALVITGVWKTAKTSEKGGIWYGGLGTVLVGLTVLLLPAYNMTAFYPSKVDLQSSLTIYNASSSPYTLQVMTYVALAIPFVLAYIAYVWWAMNRNTIKIEDTGDRAAY